MSAFADHADALNPFIQAPLFSRERAIKEAVLALCRDAPVWTEQLPLTLEAGVMSYTVPAPELARVVYVLGVEGLPVGIGWSAARADQITLSREPAAGDVVVRGQFAPTQVATTAPDHLFEAYWPVIEAYALHWLFLLPEQHNPQFSAHHKLTYEGRLAQVKIDLLQQFSSVSRPTARPLYPFI